MFKLVGKCSLLALAIYLSAGMLNAMASDQAAPIQPMPSANIDYDWPVDDVHGTRVKLSIPARFLDLRALDGARDYFCPDSPPLRLIGIKTRWPGLEPITSEDRFNLSTSGTHPIRELGETLSLFMLSKAVHECNGKRFDALRDQLESELDALKTVWVPVKMPVKAGSTTMEAWGSKTVHQEQADEKSPRFGLKHFGIDFKKYPDVPKDRYSDFFRNDVYYARNADGSLKNVIWCDAEEVESGDNYFNPVCHHEFVLQQLNASVSVDYRRVYLKDWDAIQSKLEMFILSFVDTH